MPWPIALGGAAVSAIIAVPLVVRVLTAIGLSVVTYLGVNALWETAQAQIWALLGGVSANILTILVMARVDDALMVVFSAGTSKLILKGLNAAGAFSRVRWNFLD